MRLLWLSHFVPYPPRGGNLQRSYNLLRQAAKSYDVFLVALNVQGASQEQVAEYRSALGDFCSDVEIWEPPYPWKGRRWQAELIRSAASHVPFTFRPFFSEDLSRRWTEKLAAHPEALVHIDAIDLALFARAAEGFRKVLNHHNCESALLQRRAVRETNPLKKAFLELEARKIARWERELSGKFQVNTVVSEDDARLLRSINPAAHIHVVENGVDTDYFQPLDIPEEPHSLIFTGSLDWQPNISAIQYFVRNVWPLVKRRCPDAKLFVAGRSPAKSVLRLAERDSSIAVIPSPKDMRPLLARASVYICPLLEGGGTRLKILDAMAMGKPVVSTGIGCEGLRVTPGKNILVGETVPALADMVLRLFADGEMRSLMGGWCRRLAEGEYAWPRMGRALERAYRCADGVTGCSGESLGNSSEPVGAGSDRQPEHLSGKPR